MGIGSSSLTSASGIHEKLTYIHNVLECFSQPNEISTAKEIKGVDASTRDPAT